MKTVDQTTMPTMRVIKDSCYLLCGIAVYISLLPLLFPINIAVSILERLGISF